MFEPSKVLGAAAGALPRAACCTGSPELLWIAALGDALIALACVVIPLAILVLMVRRGDLRPRGLAALFGAFIFLCGATHLMDVLLYWVAAYALDAALRGVAAVVALATAVYLWMRLPELLRTPNRAELLDNNQRLTTEIETRIRLEREMHELNHTLEFRVHQRTAQLERLNHDLRQESIERKRAEEETRSLNLNLEWRVAERTAQLQLANQELEAFSYSVAHDLWAPLRAIDGFSQALLEDYGSQLPENGKRFLSRICASTQRMGVLIDSMLELSRLTRSEMMRRPVALSTVAKDVLDTLAAEQPRTDVRVVIEPDQFADGDPKYLRLVLENLLGNAWKYTSKTREATIEFGRVPEGDPALPTWFVRDNGVGFDMIHADKLFGVFQRLHTDGEFPGNGVGLATVRRIISRHGGRVWAEAKPDQGATFYFTVGPGGAAEPEAPTFPVPQKAVAPRA